MFSFEQLVFFAALAKIVFCVIEIAAKRLSFSSFLYYHK
jgi:hypothetical protein